MYVLRALLTYIRCVFFFSYLTPVMNCHYIKVGFWCIVASTNFSEVRNTLPRKVNGIKF